MSYDYSPFNVVKVFAHKQNNSTVIDRREHYLIYLYKQIFEIKKAKMGIQINNEFYPVEDELLYYAPTDEKSQLNPNDIPRIQVSDERRQLNDTLLYDILQSGIDKGLANEVGSRRIDEEYLMHYDKPEIIAYELTICEKSQLENWSFSTQNEWHNNNAWVLYNPDEYKDITKAYRQHFIDHFRSKYSS